MTIVRVNGVSISFADRQILDSVSFDISAGERVGVVGPNGSGKSTLLNLMAGLARPHSGTVGWGIPQIDIGYLPQQKPSLNIDTGRVDTERIRRAGLDPRLMHRDPDTWSGGQAVRICLADLLSGNPRVLLLDEPTNHLDVDALDWLESTLTRFPGTLIVASHDRYFLDRVATRILEVDVGHVTGYTGNYTAYTQEKAHEREIQQLAYEKYENARRQLETAIRRQRQRAQQGQASRVKTGGDAPVPMKAFYANKGKAAARTAANMERRLERLKAPAVIDRDAIHWLLGPTAKTTRQLIAVNHLGFRYGTDPWLFRETSFIIQRNDRVGLVGPNGTGKSTFVKLIRGELEPTEGELRIAPCRLAYLDQEGMPFPSYRSILDALVERHPGREREARQLLGSLLFRGDHVHQTVGSLSGGERVRLSLVDILMEKPDILLLDEPSNHLDMASRSVMEEALAAFDGAIVLASHDRYLLSHVADRLLVFGKQMIQPVFQRYDVWHEARAKSPSPADQEGERVRLEVQLAVVSAKLATADEAERRLLDREFMTIREALSSLQRRPEGRARKNKRRTRETT